MSRTWLITGTSSGFGRPMTESLLARGDRVAATIRTVGALDELRMRHGDRLWIATLDLADAAAIRDVVDRAFAALGRIDVVVSNAGHGLFGAAEELDDAEIERQIDINLLGSIRVIHAALPHLRAQGGGRILQISSEGGQLAYPNFAACHASKWGIEGFVEAVAQEVAPFGIGFTLIEPRPNRTDFGRSIVRAPAMPAYDRTPAGDIRRALAAGSFGLYGDPAKIAQAMIDVVDRDPAPMRLALGPGSYERLRTALSARLAELDALQDITRAMQVED